MKRSILILVFLASVTGVLFLFGCGGDDDNGTTPDPKVEGDTLDQVFFEAVQTFEEARNTVNDGYSRLLALALNNVNDFVPIGTYYDSTLQYWHFDDSSDFLGIINLNKDSIRLYHSDTIVQWADSAFLTAIRGGRYFLQLESPGDSMDADKNAPLDTLVLLELNTFISAPLGEIGIPRNAVINGTATITVNTKDIVIKSSSVCTRKITVSHVAQDVDTDLQDYPIGTGCPYSGIMSYAGSIFLDCVNDTTFSNTDNWSMRITHQYGRENFRVENSSTWWEFFRFCE
jgi:hypothetical protein